MKTLNSKNFKNEIKNGITVVDFWAPWCAPCRMIAPSVEELDTEMENVNFAKLNVDDAQDIAIEYNVMSIPTLIIYKDGEPQDTIIGVTTKGNIKAAIEAVQ